MEEIYRHFESIGNLLGRRVQDVIVEPVFWGILLVLMCCMVMAYSGTSQNRLTGSLVNTMRMLGSFLIDALNSIIQALRSLFGFVDVLKMLFFGHLGHGTLYVLTNYAIIFLSMASFITTMSGLSSLVGWPGLLISFGVQVLELVATMGIVICWVPPEGRFKEIASYTYCKHSDLTPYTHSNSINGSFPEQDDDQMQKTGEDPGHANGKIPKQEIKHQWGRFRRGGLPWLLALAYISSVVFSYCYMFDAIVMPGIAYDDYMESIDLVVETTEVFEQELTAYRAELVSNLERLNADISERNGLSDEQYAKLPEQIQSLQNDLSELERAADDIQANMDRVDQNDPFYEDLREDYRTNRDEQDDINAQIDDLQAIQNSGGYTLYEAIQLLNQYYANPLYLMLNEEGIERAAADVLRSFSVVLNQGITPYKEAIGVEVDSIQAVFNNYTNLCRYYAEHGGDGLDFSADEDSVQELLEHRADVLAEYIRLKNLEESDKIADSLSESAPAEGEKAASSYLNEETGKLLIAAMRVLEGVPQFPAIEEIWPSDDSGLQPPGIASYLSQLNQKYRAVNGQLSLQERAFSKLFSPNRIIAWFTLIMALALDGMIIALCCLRGREYYANNVRNRRQMIAMLFVRQFTKEEQEENERGRIRILAGTVLGILVYLLYFRLLPGSGNGSAIAAFMLIICGVMLLALLDGLREMFKKKPHDQACEENEEKSPIKVRLTTKAYKLFSKDLKCGHFWKKCIVRRPKTSVVKAGANYFQGEKDIWKLREDHRIRPQVFGCADYDEIVTSCTQNTEYYVLAEQVTASELTTQFAILLSFGLVYRVRIPADHVEDGQNETTESKPAYLLTKDFIRLLYECIMLRTLTGNSWDYGMADDLLDYEREDDNEED